MHIFALIVATVAGPALAEDQCDAFATEIAMSPARSESPGSFKVARKLITDVPDSADIVIIGDSITYGWTRMLGEAFPSKDVWNFSVGGDKTQNAIWRLDQAETDHLRPENVVIFIGTNNLGVRGTAACAIYTGITRIVEIASEHWSPENIFVVTIPPRGADFHQFDKLRLDLNGMITKGGKAAGYIPVVLNDIEFTCGQYSLGIPEPVVTGCERPVRYECQNYRPDNLHFDSQGYVFLRHALRDSSVAALGRDVLQ